MDINKIKKKWKQGKGSHPSGIHCECVDISPKKVAKIYTRAYIRDFQYRRHQKVAKLGLAPKVYQKFKMANHYGYTCEKVFVCSHIPLESGYYCEKEFEKLIKKYWSKEIRQLKDDLFKNKVYYGDFHLWNIGWTNDLRVVLIDFGTNSYSRYGFSDS